MSAYEWNYDTESWEALPNASIPCITRITLSF